MKLKKKWIGATLAFVLLLSCAGCGSEKKHSDTVSLTMDASFFAKMTEEDINEEAKKNGYVSWEINDDGSVTYELTKEHHNEILAQYRNDIDSMVQSLLNGDAGVESFVRIEHDDTYSSFEIYQDVAKENVRDSLFASSLCMYAGYYQAARGLSEDEIDVTVSFFNNETGEEISSLTYKEAAQMWD